MGRRARKSRHDGPQLESIQPTARAAPVQWWLAAALVLITILAYLPAMQAGFIWDDDYYITRNLALRSLDGLANIWLVPSTEPQYYPLTHTTFWIEHHLWGNSPVGYHITNVLLHAASAIILWRLLLRLKVPGAPFVAALFAVHPVGVESVAWVTERKNVLSGFLYLLAATLYWRAIGEPDEQREPSVHVAFYVAAVFLFVGALLSKTVASTLPAAMLLVLWWKRGRLHTDDFFPALPLLVIGAVLGMGTAVMERTTVGAVGPDWNLSAADRILIAGRAAWFYVGKLLWPTGLTFIYPKWSLDPAQAWQWLFPAAAASAVVALFALRRRIGRGPVTAVLFFIGSLVPALGFFNIFPMLYSYVADHFQYMASIGIFALVCGTIASTRWLPRSYTVTAGIAVVLTCTFLTFRQAGIYRDLKTLWTDTLAKNPGAWMASSNLARIYLDEAEPLPPGQQKQLATKARELLERAIAQKDNNPTAVVHLGSALSILGDENGAVAQWEKVMGMRENTNPQAWPIAASNAQYQIGRHYRARGENDKAMEHFAQALNLQPGNVAAMVQMASLLASAGEFGKADQLFTEAARLDPDSPHLWTSIGNFRLQAGKPQEALAAFEQAISLSPRHFPARYGKAVALASAGQLAAAETDLRDLVKEDPDSPQALTSLGTVLLKTGRTDEARALLQRALQIQPDNPQALRQLQLLNSGQ